MAIVMKKSGPAAEAKAAPKPSAKLNLSLATEKSEPPTDLGAYSILIYGTKGIGKTSLASQFKNAYFLSTEPGTKALRVLGSHVPDWDHFVGYVDLLVAQNDASQTVVVDVIDLAYDFIYAKICDALMITSPTEENDYGATWKKIRKMFRDQVQRLCALPGGVVFLSHDAEREVELRDGSKVDKIVPTMSKQAMGEIEGLVDIIGHYHTADGQRFLQIQPTEDVIAKCRPVESFLVAGGTPGDAGDQIKKVRMGGSSKEAYANLIAAFNNQQENVDGLPVTGKPVARPRLGLKLTHT